VLCPQKLADVFKCVITCHAESTNAIGKGDLFEKGVLHHNLIENIWSGYERRLCTQFLTLLHNCELCYEMFDINGASTNRSFVPSLLGTASKRLIDRVIREDLLRPPQASSNKKMISEGYIKISFDCLLPNFFPKLMVRLRNLIVSPENNSSSYLSRHHFLAQHPEFDEVSCVVRSSIVCVVEDFESKSLMLYPGGISFSATAICSNVIYELLKQSFAGMCVEDLMFNADAECLNKIRLYDIFSSGQSGNCHPRLNVGNGMEISLSFLSCWFKNTASDITMSSDTLSQDGISFNPFENSLSEFKDSGDKSSLVRCAIENISIVRLHLGLAREPSILWLIGHSNTPSCQYYLYAVSPSLKPGFSWEVVVESEVPLSHISLISQPQLDATNSSIQIWMEVLSHLLPRSKWPHHISEWGISFPDRMAHDHKESILKQIRQREADLFTSELNMYGVEVYYSKEIVQNQRGQLSVEKLKELLRDATMTIISDR